MSTCSCWHLRSPAHTWLVSPDLSLALPPPAGALNGIWCCAPEGDDASRNPYAHLKEPEQQPNDGTLRHRKPPGLAVAARGGVRDERLHGNCRY
jgi:hypothetical protein